MRRASFKLLLIAVLLVRWKASASFEAVLQVRQTNYVRKTSAGEVTVVEKPGKWSARCVVSPSRWSIENTFALNATAVYTYDGTNVVHATKITSAMEIPEHARTHLPPELTNVHNDPRWTTISITPGDHPLHNIGANLPWFALCSSAYLRKPKRVVPLPNANIRYTSEAFAYQDRTVTFDDALGLPRKASFVASTKLIREAASHESLLRVGRTPEALREALAGQPKLPPNFVRARYEVLAYTNSHGISIPTEFVYEGFTPDSRGTAFLSFVAHGTVSSIEFDSAANISLPETEKYSVVDFRFRDKRKLVDEIHYTSSDPNAKPVTDPSLRRTFESQVAVAPVDPLIKARLSIYCLFAVLVAGPLLAAAVSWVRRRTRRDSEAADKGAPCAGKSHTEV